MQHRQVVALSDVVLYGLQLCLAQFALILAPILLRITALIQNGLEHIVVRKLLNLVLDASQAQCGGRDVQLAQFEVPLCLQLLLQHM